MAVLTRADFESAIEQALRGGVMGMPKNGSPLQLAMRALTNQELSTRVSMIRDNRRAFDKETSDAILDEAQRRIRWNCS